MNINAVLAHLVEMTPPQRKQFAQMHMDDPMMLSAAKYVDNQIAKQAAAIAAQQMGMAPPPVNQQVVAQMTPQPSVRQAAPQPQAMQQPLPEDTGIAQLPAPNMQGMAAGGIVAFADRGAVDLGSILDQARASDKATEQKLNSYGLRQQSQDPQGYQAAQAARQAAAAARATAEKAYTADMEAKGVGKPISAAAPIGAFKDLSAGTPAVVAAPPAPAIIKDDRTRRNPANYAPAVAAPAEAAPKEKTGIDQLRAPSAAPAPTIQASSAPATASPNYSADFNAALKSQGNPRDNLPPEIAEVGDLAQAQHDKAMALADKQEQGLKTLVDERTARQNAREQNIAQQEAVNPWMSMITGGLGIAQSKGKGLSGLAEGSQLGINQYMTEAKYTNAQRQKLEDARDSLQDLKYNAETMTNKDRLAAENSLTQGLMAVKDATVKHIQHKEDVNERTAGHIFDAGVQQGLETQREGSQERLHASDNAQRLAIARMEIGAANARASQLPGEARTLMALGGGDLKRGMEMQASISAGKFNPLTAYTSHYLPGFAGKETLTPPMTYPQFLATLGMPAVRP
jgi:hypothetical protein